MKKLLLFLVFLIVNIQGCEIELDYDYDTLPPFFEDCSSCPDFTTMIYPPYANATDTTKYTKISDCIYNYTCLTVQKYENFVSVNVTDELKINSGYFVRVQLTDKVDPELGDPINVFDALGFKCINGLWYVTKFPYGLYYHDVSRRTDRAPESLIGMKLPIQSMSIICQ